MVKLSKAQFDAIGLEFPIKGCSGKLKVIGIDYATTTAGKWCRKHIYECTICSADEELWPSGSISAPIYEVRDGKVPCGCSSAPKWKEYQNVIRVVRKCELLDLIFDGWEGEYKGHSTSVKIRDKLSGTVLPPPRLLGLLRRLSPYNMKIVRTDAGSIERFLMNPTFKGFKFSRSERVDVRGSKVFWDTVCPICKVDKFTLNGLCSGVFQAAHSTLSNGWLPCRCGASHSLTKEQRKFEIEEILGTEGGSFLNWIRSDAQRSKFKWVCSQGHQCATEYVNFINAGVRCPSCADYGYSPHKPANLYLMSWVGLTESYLKFGITNNEVSKRMQQISKGTEMYGSVLDTYHSNIGYEVERLEKYIKTFNFEGASCTSDKMANGFTETVEYTEYNYEKLTSFFKNLNKNTTE
ncbi:hypothetical protein NVP1193O_110 [Vibrio phage 1.193.O._10N.286.52.C6]|nr:hypothetical protein NVP1193O_110 [Vibrio phage 1.193.O._10N.286.52.C6]